MTPVGSTSCQGATLKRVTVLTACGKENTEIPSWSWSSFLEVIHCLLALWGYFGSFWRTKHQSVHVLSDYHSPVCASTARWLLTPYFVLTFKSCVCKCYSLVLHWAGNTYFSDSRLSEKWGGKQQNGNGSTAIICGSGPTSHTWSHLSSLNGKCWEFFDKLCIKQAWCSRMERISIKVNAALAW